MFSKEEKRFLFLTCAMVVHLLSLIALKNNCVIKNSSEVFKRELLIITKEYNF